MTHSPARWLVPLLLLVAVVVALWYFRSGPEAQPPADDSDATRLKADKPSGPRYPLSSAASEPETQKLLIPLPPLDDSDKYFELALEDVFGEGVGDLLVDKALIEKVVATIDNLPRSHVAERVRPTGAAPGDFAVLAGDDEDSFVLGPDNYARYDTIANRLAGANIENVVDVYRRFYPLLQEAYVSLGYPGKYFNDRVVEVIDHLQESPSPSAPIRLVRPHVLYRFADPELEALSSGQKLMIRIGSDNAGKVKYFLAQVRPHIATVE